MMEKQIYEEAYRLVSDLDKETHQKAYQYIISNMKGKEMESSEEAFIKNLNEIMRITGRGAFADRIELLLKTAKDYHKRVLFVAGLYSGLLKAGDYKEV